MVVAEVEAGLDLAAEAFAPLSCLADRTYGQTRIIIWSQPTPASPSIPEPSIP